MNVTVAPGPLAAQATDALALFLHEGAPLPSFLAADVAALAAGVVAQGDFSGKLHQQAVLYTVGAAFTRLVLVGLGKPGELTYEKLRGAAGKAATGLRGLGAQRVTLAVPAAGELAWKRGVAPLDAEGVGQAFGEGALLSLYQMNEYRTQNRDELKAVTDLAFVASDAAEAEAVARGVEVGRLLAASIADVRDLVLHPGNVITPTTLAEAARRLGEPLGLKVSVLDRAALQAGGFGALLAIGQGSVEPPCMIVMEWAGGAAGEAPIGIVGKGMTFDTGGIGIKPSSGMEKMKYDMAGGGATIGILLAAARLGLKRNVVGVVAAAENMPSGHAIQPGDVITSYSGHTIEINDTDAEGRVVLADALAYAIKEHGAQALVDMATLTGAVGVALGRDVMGVMGNHQALVERIIASGERAGERGWQLPLFEEYDEFLKSDIADYKNYGGGAGGAITAASFLQCFVGDTPWVHLDIAGSGWADAEKPYLPKGPTGSPLRMVIDLLRHWEALPAQA